MLENIIGSGIVDYCTIMGERILPFKSELDLESSVLYPEQGQCQKFCYDIQGVGRDSLQYEDLSCFVMWICKDTIDVSNGVLSGEILFAVRGIIQKVITKQ